MHVLTSGLGRSSIELLALMPRILHRLAFLHRERLHADGESATFVDTDKLAILVEVKFLAGIMWVVICRRR